MAGGFFAAPSKATGEVALVNYGAGGKVSRQVISTPKKEFFYHHVAWLDVDGDATLDIVAARAKFPTVGKAEGELVWLFQSAAGQWQEQVLASGPDVYFTPADRGRHDGGGPGSGGASRVGKEGPREGGAWSYNSLGRMCVDVCRRVMPSPFLCAFGPRLWRRSSSQKRRSTFTPAEARTGQAVSTAPVSPSTRSTPMRTPAFLTSRLGVGVGVGRPVTNGQSR